MRRTWLARFGKAFSLLLRITEPLTLFKVTLATDQGLWKTWQD